MEQPTRGGSDTAKRGRRKKRPTKSDSNATTTSTASLPSSSAAASGGGRGRGKRRKGRGGRGRGGSAASTRDDAASSEAYDPVVVDIPSEQGVVKGSGASEGGGVGKKKKREPKGKRKKEDVAKLKELEQERQKKEEEEAEARRAQEEREAEAKRLKEEQERLEEERRKRKKDIEAAAAQVRDARKVRIQKRLDWSNNVRARDNRPSPEALKKLDSGIKKNTSLIKKIKHSVTDENIGSICKELERLNLTRYVSEVVSAIAELKMKANDVDAVVRLCSMMHQRYPEFGNDLVVQLEKKLSTIAEDTAKSMKGMPEQEKKDLFLRRRSWLKLLVELFISGVTQEHEVVLSVVTDLVDSSAKRFSDSDSAYYDLWLLITFVRSGAEDLLGIAPSLPEPITDLLETRRRLTASTALIADSTTEDNSAQKEEKDDKEMEGLTSSSQTEGEPQNKIVERGNDAEAGEDSDRQFCQQFDALLDEMTTAPEEDEIVPAEVREKFWAVVKRYWDRLCKVILKLHERIRDKEESNRLAMETKGVLPEGAADAYEQNLKMFEKLVGTTSQLAEMLQLQMVELPKDDRRTRITSKVSVMNANSERVEIESVFDDEDTRSFYEDLLDLRAMLPPVLFGEQSDAAQSEDSAAIGDSQQGELADGDVDSTEEAEKPSHAEMVTLSPKHGPSPDAQEDEEEDEGSRSGDGTSAAIAAAHAKKNRLEQLLLRMQNCVNRDLIDEVAVDFCYVNSKSSRRKLVKTLFTVHRTKLVLLPYYARLTATLNKCMPDIGPALVEMLEQEFKFLRKKTDQQDIESKVKNIRFLSELVMFKVCQVNVVFNCLRHLLNDFVPQSIEVTCNLLETCGRYLYRSPETHVRTSNLLATLQRLKAAKYLDPRLETMLENAYYHCKPPERAAIQRKIRPPIREYIRMLLFTELSKESLKRVLLQMRKLPWDEEEDYIVSCLCKPWKVTYAGVPSLANIVASLSKFNSRLGVRVVDLVLEDIYCSLVGPVDASKNQRRVTTVRYLGELYYFCMVDANVIFDLLYSLIIEDPTRQDDPRDCFPIRLVCTLLCTCGQYFDKGSTKKRLDRYLVYFQRYYFSRPFIPIDIEYMVADTFELVRPKLKRFTIAAQANEAVEKLAAMPRPARGGQLHANPVRPGRFLVSSSSETFDDDDEEEEEEEEAEEEEEEPAVQSVVETQDYVRTTPGFHKSAEKVTEEDEEFDRMFKSMLQESMDSRRLERRGAGLTMVPTNVVNREDTYSQQQSESTMPTGRSVMKFSLLMKKGNKPTAVGLEVPMDSPLVIHTQAKMAEEKEAREDIKRYVLDYEKQEEQESFNALGVTHTGTGKERMSQKQRRAQQAGRIFSSTQRPYLKQQ